MGWFKDKTVKKDLVDQKKRKTAEEDILSHIQTVVKIVKKIQEHEQELLQKDKLLRDAYEKNDEEDQVTLYKEKLQIENIMDKLRKRLHEELKFTAHDDDTIRKQISHEESHDYNRAKDIIAHMKKAA